MAAQPWQLYNAALQYIGDGTHDLNDDTDWAVALFAASSNCATLTNGVFADLTDELPTANGYTAGGQILGGQTYTETGGVATFDSDDVEWTASGGDLTARFAVYYRLTTVNLVVQPLLCVCELDDAGDVTASDGNPFRITMDPAGLFTVQRAA